MKRKRYAALCILAAASIAAGCGNSFKASDSTVYITKKGPVIGANIEDFNKEYYDEGELKKYITESVEDYVASNGNGSVELDSFKTESSGDGVQAHLYLNYASYIDYAQFNGVELYAGTVQQAQEEGYAFDGAFQKAEKGELAGSADAAEILAQEGLKAVIIKEETLVKIDGDIQYVSDGNVELAGEDTAKVHYGMEDADAQAAYIVYQ